jgi:flagellar protein FlbD
MIQLNRLNGFSFYLNPELIEQIESAPDTVITTITGNNFVVRNSMEDVLEKIMAYRERVSGLTRSSIESWKLKETV